MPKLPASLDRRVRATLEPYVMAGARQVATQRVQRLYGFWTCWHMSGGRQGLLEGGWAVSTLTEQRSQFLQTFGVDVDEAWPLMRDGLLAGLAKQRKASQT